MAALRFWPALLMWVCVPIIALALVPIKALTNVPIEALTQDAHSQRDLDCLRRAYDASFTIEEAHGDLWLHNSHGARVLYHTNDAHRSALSGDMGKATVRESMAQLYPLEPQRAQPGPNDRPGRLRSYALLESLYAMYGQRRQGVGKYAVTVSAHPGMAAATQRVMEGLAMLVRVYPHLAAYILPLGGHARRSIAGTDRPSPHSYGIAIDLNPKKGAYWRWTGGEEHPAQASYPTEIVTLFESEGFIWGGKWREYDLMHFEYRPELICISQSSRSRKL